MMDVQTLTDLEMAGESRRRQDHGPDKQQRDGHGQRKEVRKENVKRVYKKEATIIVDLRDEKDVKVKVGLFVTYTIIQSTISSEMQGFFEENTANMRRERRKKITPRLCSLGSTV